MVRISFVKTSENDMRLKIGLIIGKKSRLFNYPRIYNPFPDSRREYLIPKNSERLNVDPSKIICTQPSERVTFRGNGDVLPCCSHFATEIPIGNLHENTFEEISKSKKIQKLKNNLLQPFGYKKIRSVEIV